MPYPYDFSQFNFLPKAGGAGGAFSGLFPSGFSGGGAKPDPTTGTQGSASGSVIDVDGAAAPQADFSGLEFMPISPMFIPVIQVPYVDPLEATRRYGEFNLGQFQQNLQYGGQNALQLLQLEFEGLKQFNTQARQLQKQGVVDENAFNQLQVAAANAFNREEAIPANVFNREQIGEANVFNQMQRLQQLEKALPGARDLILKGLERGGELAEGRFPSSIEDRAFEVAARNAAGEGAVVRGFGDDSVFGRRSSDLLSAQQRLQLSQVGEQSLDRFLTLGANLAFDQPIKQNPILSQPLQFQPQQVTTASQIPGAPARPASELAVQQQGALNQLTTIAPAQAIQFDIGQNQFQANMTQRTNEFNSRSDFAAQQFNSSGALQVQLEQLYADVFNAQQAASAQNLATSRDIAQDQFEAGQTGQLLGAAAQIGGAIFGPAISSWVTGALGLNKPGVQAGQVGGVIQGGKTAGAQGAGQAEGAIGTSFAEGATTADFTRVPATYDAGGVPTTIGGLEVTGSGMTATGEAGWVLSDGSTVGSSALTGGVAVGQNGIPATVNGVEVVGSSMQGGVPGYELADGGFVSNADLPNQSAVIDLSEASGTAGATALTAMYSFARGVGAAEVAQGFMDGSIDQTDVKGAVGGYFSGFQLQGYNKILSQLTGGEIEFHQNDVANASLMAAAYSTGNPYVMAAAAVYIGLSEAFDFDIGGTSKSEDQYARDGLRDYGQDLGLFFKPTEEQAQAQGLKESHHYVKLSDGSLFDIGLDGGHKWNNYGTNINGKTDRNTYDIDWSDPRANQTVGYLNPVAFMMYGEHSDKMVGHLWNAATSNNRSLSESKANVKQFADTLGIDHETGQQLLKQYYTAGKLDKNTYLAYLNGWNELMLTNGVPTEIRV